MPSIASDASAGQPVFAAVLTHHRSLSTKGLRRLLLFVAAVAMAVSIPFYMLGAWPVVGFMGLDVVLIVLAFRASNRQARGFEEVVVSPVVLVLRKVSWRGVAREWRFNPRWTRLKHDIHHEFGSERLALVEGRREVELAGFLGRGERADFATALGKALGDARRG